MEQNKGLNIALLAAVFAVSLAAGYFLGQLLPNDDSLSDKLEESEYHLDPYAHGQIPAEPQIDSAVIDSLEAELDSLKAIETEEAEVEVEEPQIKVYDYFSDQQMEDLINSGDYETNRPDDYKGRFVVDNPGRIRVTNLPDGVKQPNDLGELCGNKDYEFGGRIWTGVRNVRCTRDEQTNQITRISLEVIWEGEYEN